MDLSKSYEFFKPESVDARIHILGCGSVGSTIAENLVRCGVTKLTLWDFDTVEEHNIVNQMFRYQDVGRPKVEALRDILVEINPDAAPDIELKPEGWQGKLLSGYLFLAVDSMDLRRKIVEKHIDSPFVRAVFDVRTMLTGAQHYAADWSSYQAKQNLLASMQFSDEDAEEEVSACGTVLGVATTVRLISALCVNNFINFIKGKELRKIAVIDGFSFNLTAF